MRAASLIAVLLVVGSSVSWTSPTSARGDEVAAPNPNLPDLQEVPAPIPDPPVRRSEPVPAVGPQSVPALYVAPSDQKTVPVSRESRVYRVRHTQASKVAEAIDLYLRVKHKIETPRDDVEGARWTIVAEASSNSIIASAERGIQSQIERLVWELDAPTQTFLIQMKIRVKDGDGEFKVWSRPQIIMTIGGQPAMVSVGSRDGMTIEVELTPRVVDEQFDDK
jgi:hypothetical protein